MSARKLGRLAGLVFVLAAIIGGSGAAGTVHRDGTSTDVAVTAQQSRARDLNWL